MLQAVFNQASSAGHYWESHTTSMPPVLQLAKFLKHGKKLTT